ncbi:MAG: glycine cleavage system aminomethyltransferase GcvT [Gammaproteobacteria bacterium]
MKPEQKIKYSPLKQLHDEYKAQTITFAGWEMPLSYTGIINEHLHTRSQASLFDVSHMGQLRLTGTNPLRGLEQLSPSDLVGLKPMTQRYTLLLNQQGGAEDDCMIGRACLEEETFVWMVVNAAQTAHDLEILRAHLTDTCQLELWADRALLALQGPASVRVMSKFCPQAAEMRPMDLRAAQIQERPCLIATSGYTGELGYEISCYRQHAYEIASLLVNEEEVQLAGLGARDSLRLEAGLCLYGQDLRADTTPVEAQLKWLIAPARRQGGEREGGFLGAERIFEQLRNGTTRRRTGFKVEGRIPVRQGAAVLNGDGIQVGEVTSGGFAPSLNAPYAMGYIQTDAHDANARFHTQVRNRQINLQLTRPAQIKNT